MSNQMRHCRSFIAEMKFYVRKLDRGKFVCGFTFLCQKLLINNLCFIRVTLKMHMKKKTNYEADCRDFMLVGWAQGFKSVVHVVLNHFCPLN